MRLLLIERVNFKLSRSKFFGFDSLFNINQYIPLHINLYITQVFFSHRRLAYITVQHFYYTWVIILFILVPSKIIKRWHAVKFFGEF